MMPSTDKNSERKNDLELKHISDELIDCSNKMQLFFVAKIESNFKLIAQTKQVKEFIEIQ